MRGNGIRNKKISLVFTSLVLSTKHGKVISDSTGKVWENRTFRDRVFLTYFARSRNPYNSQNSKHGKSGFPQYGKSVGKHKHFKFMCFLNISAEAEIHTILKTCGKWISTVREKCGKTQTFQSYRFLKYFGWHRNP